MPTDESILVSFRQWVMSSALWVDSPLCWDWNKMRLIKGSALKSASAEEAQRFFFFLNNSPVIISLLGNGSSCCQLEMWNEEAFLFCLTWYHNLDLIVAWNNNQTSRSFSWQTVMSAKPDPRSIQLSQLMFVEVCRTIVNNVCQLYITLSWSKNSWRWKDLEDVTLTGCKL